MILTKDFFEFSNILTAAEQDLLLKRFTHQSFPWGFSLDSVYGANGDPSNLGAIGFFHNLMFDGQQRSEDLPAVWPVLNAFQEKVKDRITITKVGRIRAGLFTKHPDSTPHGPHTDAIFPHWTAVYYVNDCDGDFILYNETYEDYTELEIQKNSPALTIKHVCKPNQGTLIAFNGKHYHSSSYPTIKPYRLAITFNFDVEYIM